MNNQRPSGVIFDVEDQPDILTPLQSNGNSGGGAGLKNCGPFIAQEESPLQRPRPPERPRKRSFQNRWSQRLSSAVILNRSNSFSASRYKFSQNAHCQRISVLIKK